MGYTHYWYRKDKEHSAEEWKAFVDDCKVIAKNLPDKNAQGDPLYISGCFKYQKPQFTKANVHFNGDHAPAKDRVQNAIGDWPDSELSHETFVIPRVFKGNESTTESRSYGFFGCCKTARKPYDVMVTACLILYKYHFGKDVEISSDGDPSEWADGWKLIGNCHPKGKEIVADMYLQDSLFEQCITS